jgi:hypothetical protein
MAGWLPGRRAATRIAAGFVAGIVVAAAVLFALRKPLVEWLAESYLASQGARGQVQIERWDGEDLSVRVSLGKRPDFSAEIIEFRLDPNFWLPHIESVAVSHARVHLGFDGRAVSFGSLQQLVDTFTKPSKKSWVNDYIRAPLPVALKEAQIAVDTPAGTVEIAGQAEFVGSNIQRAEARLASTDLRMRDLSVHIAEGAIQGRWTGSGFDATGDVIAGIASRGADGTIRTATVHAALTAKGLSLTPRGSGTDIGLARLSLDARAAGGIATIATEPALSAQLNGFRGRLQEGRLSGSGRIEASLSATQARLGTIALDAPRLAIAGLGRLENGADTIDAHLSGNSSIPEPSARALAQRIPMLGGDAQTSNAFVAAARAFRFDSDIQVHRDDAHTTIVLSKPATIASASGAHLTLAPMNAPLLSFDGANAVGGASIQLGGGGLPAADLTIAQFAVKTSVPDTPSIEATLRATASVTTRALRNATLSGAGRFTSNNGTSELVLDGCAHVNLGSFVASGKAMLSEASALLCPDPGQPLFSATPTGWRFSSRLDGISTRIVSAQSRLDRATGHIALEGSTEGLRTGTMELSAGRLSDLLSLRFEPLGLAGHASYTGAGWQGQGVLESTRHRTRIGTIAFSHTLATGKGEAFIDARNVRFVPNGFAPADISPLLTTIARADGKANFTGHIGWTPKGITSEGQLDVDAFQFASPMGGASGTTTHIKFISLLPPETAPDQSLGIDRIAWMSPLSAVSARFHFTPRAIDLGGASAQVAAGTAKIDPLTWTFGSQTLASTLRLSQIDLGALLASSNLASKVHLQAQVSGTLPFSIGPEGLRIKDGVVAATKPGRISIDRSLWASGQVTANAMQDFAYQALENLAFDRLQGRINSLPGGRLGLLLHIEGRNDPPKPTDTRIGLVDLLRGQAFAKPLPLPKGTPIDLTLDTSLNFDELLRAYRAASSPSIGTTAR